MHDRSTEIIAQTKYFFGEKFIFKNQFLGAQLKKCVKKIYTVG